MSNYTSYNFTNYQIKAFNEFCSSEDNKKAGAGLYLLYKMKKHADDITDIGISLKNIDKAIATLKKERYAPNVDIISDFTGDYAFLSNYFEYPEDSKRYIVVDYNGILFTNSEAAFQAQKLKDKEEQESFAKLSPDEAKKAGKKIIERSDWDDVKVDIMHDIVREKFFQNTDLMKKLIDTDNSILIEENWWGDKFWGMTYNADGVLVGENHLGKILMSIREEFDLFNAFWGSIMNFNVYEGDRLLKLMYPNNDYKCIGLYPVANSYHQAYEERVSAKDLVATLTTSQFESDYINVLFRKNANSTDTYIETVEKHQLIGLLHDGEMDDILNSIREDSPYSEFDPDEDDDED